MGQMIGNLAKWSESLVVSGSKTEDRCGTWYLGHLRPGLALREGETDVNELLSCSD